ncbi:MAG: hypothetical protein AMS25_03035 [Gemmatimonas sp. SM23_52]|nr:MAG: hypothetical protein AMS25_03035 [Gemmatimonas sp. SM23_52]
MAGSKEPINLGRYERLRAVSLSAGSDLGSEKVAGKGEDPQEWEIIEYTGGAPLAILLIGKVRK